LPRQFQPSRYRKLGQGGGIVDAIKRWLALLDLLRVGDYPNKTTLAATLRYDARTIQTDIGMLKREFDAEQNGFYLTDRRWRLGDGRPKKGR
jgi:hypothetical protein